MGWGSKPAKSRGILPSTKINNERKQRNERNARAAAEQRKNTPIFSRNKKDNK